MRLVAFCELRRILFERNLVHETIYMPITEQVLMFLHTIGHNVRFRVVDARFHRSTKTTHRYFKIVLKAILQLYRHVVRLPDNSTPPKIRNSRRFYPYFKDCVGVIDGTHVRASVPIEIQGRFRGQKGGTAQNVLVAITFDLRFTYMLAGWEGSAHDSRILNYALSRPRGLKIPKEFSDHLPENAKELFNLRHSSLRTTIERGFGVIKKGFRVLDAKPFWSFNTQADVVLACGVIHNHIMGVDPNDPIMQAETCETESSDRVQPSRREAIVESREWNNKRDEICQIVLLAIAMSKNKGKEVLKNKEKEPGSQLRWTQPMCDILFKMLVVEAEQGNKPSNKYKPQSLDKVAKEIGVKFNIECHASHAHPTHAPYLNKKIEQYDEMAIVVGKDMATGGFSKQWSERSPLIAVAITALSHDLVNTNELHKVVMNVEGCEEDMLDEAFDHLVNDEKAGRAFMAKNGRMRKL
ncbi:uncharacterized protein LOC115952109 [Quercus lobata]|uniref:uncharacterized protein LOC115952109 n=1 Tax=Quercus lobata TaxID=97700 RepID=UPI001246EA20|nr:uncharacterized protein LOC115952109 [Quercus lobata]